jgi:hypothetical protein
MILLFNKIAENMDNTERIVAVRTSYSWSEHTSYFCAGYGKVFTAFPTSQPIESERRLTTAATQAT